MKRRLSLKEQIPRKKFCECGTPIDPDAVDGSGRQCRPCLILNRKVLSWHEKTRRWIDPDAWFQSHQKGTLSALNL